MLGETMVPHPNMEFTPPPVSESVTNSYKKLALRIRTILEKKQNMLVDAPMSKWAFYELRDGITGLSIVEIKSRESAACKDADLPVDFILPAYTFKILSRDEQEIVDTPYGSQPTSVKTDDGSIYTFGNYFIVNEYGQGAKCEFVAISVLNKKDALAPRGWVHSLKTVGFIPNEGDSRYIHPSDKDHAEIGEKLQLIETGQFIKHP